MNNVKIDLEKIESFYDNEYFKLVKQLQIYCGIWPYQKGFKSVIRRSVVCFILSFALLPFINGLRLWCGKDLDLCCENLVGCLFIGISLMKLFITITSKNKFITIFQTLAINWLTFMDPKETAIMEKYAQLGKVKYIAYFGVGLSLGSIFSSLPLLPIFMDIIHPLNETRKKILFVKAEHAIDPYEYYYVLYVYYLIVGCTFASVASIDAVYTMITHQNFGLISVIRYRLLKLSMLYESSTDYDCVMIIESVKLHNDVLRSIDVVESSYSLLFLLIIICTIICWSATAIVAISSFYNNSLTDSIRASNNMMVVMMHLLYLSWPGQMLIDHNDALFVSVYTNEWYNISQKGKQLLKIIMMKCIRPCHFTAGGIYVMNFYNFGSIVKTAVTYMTAAVSLRK